MSPPSLGSTPSIVLIIEDSPVVQHLIKASLQPLGVSTLVAGDGETGIDLALAHVPDLITLDIGLPGIDGWGVLTELRSRAETAHIPVIVVTAHGEAEVANTAEARGVEGFMTKPFRPAELALNVESLLGDADQASTG